MPKNFNPHAVIFSLAGVLALATASECHSITHLPSLLYGAVLWGWWAVIASAFWRLGQRMNCVANLSPRTISLHILAGSVLGIAHLMLLGTLDFPHAGWRAVTSLLNINRLGMELLLYGFLFGITGVIQSQIRMQREAMRDATGTTFPL
jgi:hypothetical protein